MVINKLRDTDAEIGIFKDFRYQFLALTVTGAGYFRGKFPPVALNFHVQFARGLNQLATWRHKYMDNLSRHATRLTLHNEANLVTKMSTGSRSLGEHTANFNCSLNVLIQLAVGNETFENHAQMKRNVLRSFDKISVTLETGNLGIFKTLESYVVCFWVLHSWKITLTRSRWFSNNC